MQLSFLQSKEWQDFQKSIGRKTWRINNILLLKYDLPIGFNYLYCPRPNVLKDTFFIEANNIARKENSVFLKIDPIIESRVGNRESRVEISVSIQPQKTLVLDLRKAENKILSEMVEKTRYNIRLAERRGIVVKNFQFPISKFQKDEFWRLLQETAKRDGFCTHEKRYYEKLLDTKSEFFFNELFFAEYKGEILAAALVNFYGDTATYLHGASSRQNKELMAPHFLHWRIIQEAKRRGFAKYDFWGIDEKKWPGLTRFKLGFGGEIVEYPASVDIIYKPFLYQIYRLARKFR